MPPRPSRVPHAPTPGTGHSRAYDDNFETTADDKESSNTTRYVNVRIPGPGKKLTLCEVQVFACTPPTRAPTKSPSTASPTTSPVYSGWYLGGVDATCDATCLTEGKVCNVADLYARNGDVDSSDKIGHLVQTLGASCNGGYNTGVGTYGSVPLYNTANGFCLVSSATRPQESIKCADAAGSGKRRICYCSPTAASLPPTIYSAWFLGGVDATCDATCLAQGRVCNVADFYARNGDVDSSDEIGDMTFGSSCYGGYNTGVGTYGSVPLYNTANGYCVVSSATRPQESIKCADAAGSGKRRICYCSPTPPKAD
eukprot:gene57827-biopygen66965